MPISSPIMTTMLGGWLAACVGANAPMQPKTAAAVSSLGEIHLIFPGSSWLDQFNQVAFWRSSLAELLFIGVRPEQKIPQPFDKPFGPRLVADVLSTTRYACLPGPDKNWRSGSSRCRSSFVGVNSRAGTDSSRRHPCSTGWRRHL